MPGTLNYVEGQASIGDQTLNSQAVGSAELQNGQVLETGDGKAEILLTPGVRRRQRQFAQDDFETMGLYPEGETRLTTSDLSAKSKTPPLRVALLEIER